MKKTFWLLDVNYEVENHQPEMWIWGIDDEGKRILIVDRNFEPYFYLVVEEKEDPKAVIEEVGSRGADFPLLTELKPVNRRLFGKPVNAIKVVCRDPNIIPQYSKALKKINGVKKCLEDDIRYSMRYLIDNDVAPCGWHEAEVEEIGNEFGVRVDKTYLAKSFPKSIEKTGVPQLRMLGFSMISCGPKGAPKPERDPVVIISAATNTGEERQFVTEDSNDKTVIESFVKYVRSFDPDIIAGYGTNRQDWPYLLTRSKKLGIKLSVDRADTEPHTSVFGHVSIMGRVNIDFFDFAEDLPEVKVKTLENMVDFLGVTKLEKRTLVEDVDFHTYWIDPEKRPVLLRFSRENARCVMGVADAMLDFAMQLSNLVGLPLDQVGTAAVGFRVEWFLIQEAYKIGELIPKRVPRPYFPYAGAVVLKPKPGLHENIAVLDFKALYPNIMITQNVSPDTYIPPAKPEPPCGVNVAPEVKHRFRIDPPGFYKEVLSHLIAARDEIRPKLKELDPKSAKYRILDARQKAVKIVTNACLDYEIPVVIRKSGNISVLQIGKLIDNMLSSNNPIIHEGFSMLVKPTKKLEVLSFDPDTWEVAWRPVIQVIRHRLDNQMLEIELKSGTNVRVTAEHKMYALDKSGKLTVKKAADVNCGEWLPVLSRVPLSKRSAQPQLNLLRYFADIEPERTEKVMVVIEHPFGRRPKANYAAWHRILVALKDKPPMFIKKIAQYANYGNPRCASKHLKDLEKLGFVEKIPYVGRERKKLYKITPHGEHVCSALNVLSKKILRNSNTRCHYVWFTDIREVVEKLPSSITRNWSLKLYKSRDKLPVTVNISKELIRLIGYYVAEGTSDEYKNKTGGVSRRISWCSHNPKIRNDIARCFKKVFDLHLTVCPNSITSNSGLIYFIFIDLLKAGRCAGEKSVPNFIINGPIEMKWEFLRAYDLGDGNKTLPYTRWTTTSPHLCNQLILLTKQLGTQGVSVRRYNDILRVLVHDSLPFRRKIYIGPRMHQSFIVPREVAIPLIKELKTDYNYLRWSDSNISISLINQIPNGGDAVNLKRIRNLIEGGLHFEQVVKIHEVKQHGPHIYDISVEKPHTLFAGCGFVGVSNCYGYTGWVGARWYIKPVAEATTAWGRHTILRTIELAKKVGLEVVYGDTDSIFVKDDREKIEKISSGISETLGLEIKPDKVYDRILFTEAKKRYCGLLPDGRLDIVGLEVVRGDWAEVAKKVQERVLEIVLKERSPEKAAGFVRRFISDLREKKVSYKDLIIWKTLTRPIEKYKVRASHIEAAKKLMKEGWELSSGDKIGYVIVSGSGRLYEKAEPYALASLDEIDVEYYVSKQVVPVASRVLSMFGIAEDELLPSDKPKTLFVFMKD